MDCILCKLVKSFHMLNDRNYLQLNKLIIENEQLKTFNYKDRSIIWEAYFLGDEVVKKVVDMGVNPDTPDSVNGRIISLYVANNNVDMVEFLLRRGADPNLEELNGETPLSWACFKNSFESAKLLIKFGASANKKIGSRGGFPIDWAKNYASKEFIEWLTIEHER